MIQKLSGRQRSRYVIARATRAVCAHGVEWATSGAVPAFTPFRRETKPYWTLSIRIVALATILLTMCGGTVDAPRPALASSLDISLEVRSVRDGTEASGRNDQAIESERAIPLAVDSAAENAWPMAGANLQRTSWTPEQVPSAQYLEEHRDQWEPGKLYAHWYKPFEAYIPPRVQIIAANGLLYVSTARGLYALDAETGGTAWVYPTELPLGNSPTIYDGVAYVGGLDGHLYALDALTGKLLWAYWAGQGFYTNPLVVQGVVYAGNRDGYFYAIYAQGPNRGRLAWRYKTDGPILFSAAYQDGVLYFASNDARAYALNAQTGQLVWRSVKLPGQGFHSWWPVIYQDAESGADIVVFAGSFLYRRSILPGPGESLDHLDRDDIYPDHLDTPRGTPVGPRTEGEWIDASRVAQYFEEKPWRRTYFILDRATGREVTFDFDKDGRPDYAPILWHGTQSGNRYPPIVGPDGLLYQANNYMSAPQIAGGEVSGWKFGTPLISTPSSHWIAIDEPLAYSAGGNLIYWSLCEARSAGAFDLSVPNTLFWDDGPSGRDRSREWVYWGYNLDELLPGHDIRYSSDNFTFGGPNGVYGQHGDQNPLIPYRGKVYTHRNNAIIALGPQRIEPAALPMASDIPVDAELPVLSTAQVRQHLAAEVQKILEAGHLRPGYMSSGLFDNSAQQRCGDNLADYWHNPSETLYTLIWALPHLPGELQPRVRAYLQDEFRLYPPYDTVHVGWRDGAGREAFVLPPEIEADLANYPPSIYRSHGFEGWGGEEGDPKFPPHMFYALWKYAEVLGGAREVFDHSRDRLAPVPSDAILIQYPFAHNAYIAGYLGYLELERLAGYGQSAGVRAELDRLLDLRVTAFSKDTPYEGQDYCRALSVARNFMFLVPELGDHLYGEALDAVQEAIDEYTDIAPYWFVSKYEATFFEGVIQSSYDYNALFQAKALILKEPYEELAQYLDVPAFAKGDLFYIQNLVAALEAPHSLHKGAVPAFGRRGTSITYTLTLYGSGDMLTLTDVLPSGMSTPTGFELQGTGVAPAYDEGRRLLTWSDAPPEGQRVVIRYVADITTNRLQTLVNVAELSSAEGKVIRATATVIASARHTFLPLTFRGG